MSNSVVPSQAQSSPNSSLPEGFAYVDTLPNAQNIISAIRYSGPENALGRPLDGYINNRIIATRECGEKLVKIQKKLESIFGYHDAAESRQRDAVALMSLVVYDAYRPRKAVDDFWQWAHLPPIGDDSPSPSTNNGDVKARCSLEERYDPDSMASNYFPKFNNTARERADAGGCCCERLKGERKARAPIDPCGDATHTQSSSLQPSRKTLFERGYISKRSNHARGSTVDVTLFVSAAASAASHERHRVDVTRRLPVEQREGLLLHRFDPATTHPDHRREGDSNAPETTAFDDVLYLDSLPLRLSSFRPHFPQQCSVSTSSVTSDIDGTIRAYVLPKLTAEQRSVIEALGEAVAEAGRRSKTREAAHDEERSNRGQQGAIDFCDKCETQLNALISISELSQPNCIAINQPLPFINDGTLDMGTSFDLFDEASHPLWPGCFLPTTTKGSSNSKTSLGSSSTVNHFEGHFGCCSLGKKIAHLLRISYFSFTTAQNGAMPPSSPLPSAIIRHPTFLLRRLFLQCLFEEEGFVVSDEEWWHFWMRDGEPFPPRPNDPEFGFNFNVE